MRLRNTRTGTVVTVDDETGGTYLAGGWVRVDPSPAPESSTPGATDAGGGAVSESTPDESTTETEAPAPRRRTRRR